MQETQDPLEKEMATHSSIPAWEIPWTEEPGGLQPMGSHSWTQLSMHANAFLTLESPPICDIFTSDVDIFGCFSN